VLKIVHACDLSDEREHFNTIYTCSYTCKLYNIQVRNVNYEF
jgi:hypothetical protein